MIITPVGFMRKVATGVESSWCLSVTGNQYVSAGNVAALKNATAFTISAWMKRNASNSIAALGQVTHISSDVSMELWSDGNAYIEVGDGANSFGYVSCAGTEWHHVVMVYDGSQATNAGRLKFYVDGVLKTLTFSGTIPSTTANTSAPFEVGRLGYDTTSPYGALHDDVRIYSRALSATEIGYLYANTQNVTTGLAAYLDMEEGTGATTAVKDSTGATIATATLTNGPQWHPQTPPKLVSGRETLTHSLSFDGSNDYVTCGNVDSVTEFTVASWVKLNDARTFQMIFVTDHNAGGVGVDLRIESGRLMVYSGGGSIRSAASYTTANGWVHVAATRDSAGNGKLYVSGVQTDSGALPAPNASWFNNILLGSYSTNGLFEALLNGLISNPNLFSRALSATDIARLARGQRPVTDDPVGRWKLDEGSGMTAIDSGSGGNNGTLTNGPTYSTDVSPWHQ